MDTSDEVRGGNPCVFFTLKLLNLIFGLTAIGLVALGIWLWIQFKAFDFMEIAFICLGVFEFFLVLIAWTARKSIAKLKCYRFMMCILFVSQLTITILGFTLKQSVIDNIINKTNSQSRVTELEKYYNIVIYYVLGSLLAIFLMIALTHCYITSVKNRNFAYDYKILDEDGRKLTVDEKVQRDSEKVKAKYDQKREEMYQKYSGYKDYKLGQTG